jgi:hypothetical protein
VEPLSLPSIELPGAIDLPRMQIAVPVFPAPSHPILIPPSVEPKPPPEPPKAVDPGARQAVKGLQDQVKQLNLNIKAQQQSIDNLLNPPEIEKVEPKTTKVIVPGTPLEFALPTAEVLTVATVTAGAAAAASVGATLAAQNLTKRLKPVFQTALKKVAKARGKDPETFGRHRLKLRRNRVTPT